MDTQKHILIAEDSSVIQNITRKVLEFQSYAIDTAKNGKQVLDKMESQNYDIILMDINMPQMDGIECARHIRSMKDTKKSQIPIIAITGNAKNYTLKEFQALGINDLVEKPIDFDLLVAKLTNIL